MMNVVSRAWALYARCGLFLERHLAAWLPGLAARFVFAAVLLFYFWNSALTKVGDGFLGFFSLSPGAYIQILPGAMAAYGYDPSQIPIFPQGLVVVLGTYAEFLLPPLVVIGLATRLAALGMIGFIAVQTYVDIAFHGATAETIGAWFDGTPDAAIADQRLLWLLLLLFLVVQGAGRVSIDAILDRLLASRRRED